MSPPISPKSVSLDPVEAQHDLRVSRKRGTQTEAVRTTFVLTGTGNACLYEASKAPLEKHW
jgi:hypothetical protein